MTQRETFAFAAVPAILLSAWLHADQQPSFRSNALAVRVDALVTDGRKPVAGLAADDFELRDNGVAQTIELIDATDVPLNLVLALDVSDSTAGARQGDLVAASEALLAGLKPNDRAALTTFSHAVVPGIALTSDLASVREALLRISPSGRTSIMDGAYVSLTVTLAQPGSSLVVVCTDGSDTSSWLRPDDVLDSAKRSNAVLYAVTSADVPRVSALEDLADATGGDVLRVGSGTGLRDAFQKILQQFRSRYILAYAPTGVQSGGFHRLDVRMKRRGLSVRARPGYIGLESAK